MKLEFAQFLTLCLQNPIFIFSNECKGLWSPQKELFMIGTNTFREISAAVYFIVFLFIISSLSGCNTDASQVHRIASEEQLLKAVEHAQPGTIIEIADGDYSFDDGPLTVSVRGFEDKPVLIRAINHGKVRFAGEYAMLLENCSYVTVEGITFNNRALKHAVRGVLDSDTELGSNRDEAPLWGSLVVRDSDHCRLTRLTVAMEERRENTPERLEKRLPRVHWINLTGGTGNRVDHCRIGGKYTLGVMLVIGIGEQYFTIDHNYFTGRPPGNGNGFETIRLGTGELSPLYGIIENNLFENCDGESEIISVKSSYLHIRRNTFIDCRGMLVVRQASFVTIMHNYFINRSGKSGVGGVRIHGNDNNILNNYFGGLTGLGLMTFWGDYDAPSTISEAPEIFRYNYGAREYSYRRSSRGHIAYNTWAWCDTFLNLGTFMQRQGADMNLPPANWSFQNNIVVCKDPVFIHGSGETGFRWIGNIFWNPEGPCDPGRELTDFSIRVIDPQLVLSDDGVWRLSKNSPAIDTAEKTMWYWLHWIESTDIDGQQRDLSTSEERPFEFNTDVGADEYSNDPVLSRPLTPDDVGPDAS